MTGAPDFIEPLAGYRAWFVARDGRLEPLRGGPSWNPGVNTALCGMIESGRGTHHAPAPDCGCGLNALHSPSQVPFEHRTDDPAFVTGGIAAWGEVELHLSGFRAEFAQVVALKVPTGGSEERLRRLRRAADLYAVPLVPWQELEAAIEEVATFLPKEQLRPELWLTNSDQASVWRRALNPSQSSSVSFGGEFPTLPI